jgi:predicted enzyme related to lactoylglutathione lyase
MARAAVVQLEITGRASAQLQHFYAGLFGWDLQTTGTSDYARILPGESGMPGAVGGSWDSGPGQVTVYIELPDLQEALSLAEQLGGTVRDGACEPVEGRVPQWLPERRVYEVPEAGLSFAFVADPEGHVIALSQGRQAALGQFAA